MTTTSIRPARARQPLIHRMVGVAASLFVTGAALAAPVAFDMPEQPLLVSVQQVTRSAGWELGGDLKLLEGKTAKSLHASLEPEDALRQLLSGSQVTLRIVGSRVLVTPAGLAAQTVVVVGTRSAEGSAEAGYRSFTSSVAGPLGTRSLEELPYTVSVIPAELMENIQLTSTDDVFRFSPLTQPNGLTGRNTQTYVNLRGFSVTNQAIDGLKVANFLINEPEDKERVEIFSGLSSLLFGLANPGGMINYVLKRPTATRFTEVTTGIVENRSNYVHVDAGGPIDQDGHFGYRVNLMRQAGETEIDEQHHERLLVSGALDWHLTRDALVQFDASRSEDRLRGVPAAFVGLGTATVPYPSASLLDNSKLWSPSWTWTNSALDQGGVRVDWSIAPALLLRAGAEIAHSPGAFTTYQTGGANAAYQIRPFVGGVQNTDSRDKSIYVYLDKDFLTGPLTHKLTVGFSQQRLDLYTNVGYAQNCLSPSGTVGFANCTALASSPFTLFNSVVDFPEPSNFDATTQTSIYLSDATINTNFTLADSVSLGDRWELLAGIGHSRVSDAGFGAPGQSPSTYQAGKWTPSFSLLFKPRPGLTTYLTYIEGLQEGQIVGTGYTNTGAILPPLTSTQYELGAKLDTGGLLWTAALFDIDKPNQYSDLATPLPTYIQDGREVHRGIDFSATGRITPDLSVVAGGTWFQAIVKRSNNAAILNKEPANVSERTAKGFLEYHLPFLPALTVNGGLIYFSKFAYNATDTGYLPSVTLVDMGARYELRAMNVPLTVRLSITNAFGRNYWATAGGLGQPRTIALTGSARF